MRLALAWQRRGLVARTMSSVCEVVRIEAGWVYIVTYVELSLVLLGGDLDRL